MAVGCGSAEPTKTPNGSTESGTTDGGNTDSVDVTVFDLTVHIVLPLNQGNLFDDVVSLVLVVLQDGAEVGRWTFDDIARGDLNRAEGLAALDNAVLQIEGYDADGKMVTIGQSGSVSIASGDDEVSILMAHVESFAWLSNLTEGAAGAALVADGSGGLLLFGGTDRVASTSAPRGRATSAVRRLNLDRPQDGLVFSTVGAMPVYPSEVDEPGRAGHTATRLGGTHENRNLILVAGGSTDYWDTSQVTDHAFLWDPTTDTALESSDYNLTVPTRSHLAVSDAAGNVVISGGTEQTDEDNSYRPNDTMHFFEGSTLKMRAIEQPNEEPTWLWHGAAALGDRGVLLCGGFEFSSIGDAYYTNDGCGIVSTSGAYTPQAESGIRLPKELFHHAMVGLADGRVLVAGGATYAAGVYGVTNEAWVYDPADGSWSSVGPMHLARAMHAMVRLPDGRVMVVGGTNNIDSHWWRGENAIACAEVFNPELGDFVELASCSPTSTEGDLSGPAVLPAVAVEPVRGLGVVVGGIDRNDQGSLGAAFFLPTAE